MHSLKSNLNNSGQSLWCRAKILFDVCWHWECRHLISDQSHASCSTVHRGRRSLGDKGCQRLCPSGRLWGHRSCWDMESGKRAASSSDARCRHRAVFVGGRQGLLSLFYFITPCCPQDFFYIMLVYAVWRGPSGRSGCKSSKRVRMEAYPVRSGTRYKLTKSEQSIHALCDLVFLQLKSSNQWCTAALKINTFGVILMTYLLIEDSEYNKQYLDQALFGFKMMTVLCDLYIKMWACAWLFFFLQEAKKTKQNNTKAENVPSWDGLV